MTASAVADPAAREFLRNADPVLARLIDARPDFRPRAWADELPPFDAFGTLVFQVAGQQLSVASTRAIISHLQERFGGHTCHRRPSCSRPTRGYCATAAFPLARVRPSARSQKRFVDGRLSDEALARMTDEEVESALTEVPGIGPRSAHGFLLVALDRPDVYLTGDIALRRAIQRVYGFEHIPTQAQLTQISDRW